MKMLRESQAVNRLRQEVTRAGSQKALADEWEISKQYITDILKGRRSVSEAVALKMGLRREVVFWTEV